MILMTIDERSPLGLFLIARAGQEHKSPEDIALELIQREFEEYVRTLHKRFMRGEFSQESLAEQLGLPRLELFHLLEDLGLPVTNV